MAAPSSWQVAPCLSESSRECPALVSRAVQSPRMIANKNIGVRAQPPEELAEPEVREPASIAGGLGAIAATMKHVSEELGIVRGARLLLQLNQHHGFDCP